MERITIGSLTLLVGGVRSERENQMGECQCAGDFVSALIEAVRIKNSRAFVDGLCSTPYLAISEVQQFNDKETTASLLSDVLLQRSRRGLPTVLGMDAVPRFLKKLFPIPDKPMKIYLLERDPDKCGSLRSYFEGAPDVETVQDDFRHFMQTRQVECVVSPANAFGLMDGGYDLAITEWFGNQLQERVQQYILEHFYGEQPVGTSFLIDAGMDGQSLIHTPTMRTPQPILNPGIIYQCMRTTLMCAMEHQVGSIVIPMFGGATGRVRPQLAAEMMWKAYRQIREPPEKIDWNYAKSVEIIL